ncbi:MAG: DNA repair protein RecO [Legionellales bacterium]|nr:DNA repair protein RecO [Legionellales bacterium]|tara:strand:- start:573 stop:1271 length:699 start_codon:yes stop_codon:yes gene_type:complete
MAVPEPLATAYVLHTRPYRDTSLLVEFFTASKGRLCAVAKGARRAKSPWRSLLQPFTPLLIDTVGKHELVTLRTAEPSSMQHPLTGTGLLSGIYLNELLMRLLHRYDPHERLFQHYQQTLAQLGQDSDIATSLRRFEWQLLQEIGYGLQLHLANQQPVQAEQHYVFDLHTGLRATELTTTINATIYRGKDLLAIEAGDFTAPEVLRSAKRLMRQVFTELLGDKPLKSRELFV